ncbi:SDR family NAD(P)-dependent oxidoreductase [Camelimonas abortus]|uniref:SDR family NAD(P)-dependent oxidoreductase n=1 Tax=Camelimonas abortus TaxID=1017184 RepID=A0ABV7LBM0_9HYPH
MTATTEKPLAGRIAVITGASRGIGRALALETARQGAHVIALARTQGALEELDDEIRALGGSATLVPVDVTDYDALDRLGLAIHERWGRLDIMVANAGSLNPLAPLGHTTPREFDTVMAVNVTSVWRLVRSLDPLLQKSDAGRAIFMSSGAAHKCLAYWGPYSASKAALEALARTMAAENANTRVRVSIVNPGPLRTRMRAAAMPGEDPMTLRTPEDLAPHVVRLMRPDFQENGLIYDFPQNAFLRPQMPAKVAVSGF